MKVQEYVIVVAGGKGTRINSQVPKQFIELDGQPIILHTIQAFFSYSEKIKMILVLPEDDFITWNSIQKKYNFNKSVILQPGGATRFQSVKKGLEKIEGDGLVAIHDGVRPLVNVDIIEASFRLAAKHRSAVASVRLKESIRLVDPQSSPGTPEESETKALDRSRFRLIQTPQTFDVHLIKNAYQIKEEDNLTDDASVVERAGHKIFLFEGSYENLKITTKEDLLMAEALLKARTL